MNAATFKRYAKRIIQKLENRDVIVIDDQTDGTKHVQDLDAKMWSSKHHEGHIDCCNGQKQPKDERKRTKKQSWEDLSPPVVRTLIDGSYGRLLWADQKTNMIPCVWNCACRICEIVRICMCIVVVIMKLCITNMHATVIAKCCLTTGWTRNQKGQ